MTLDGIGSTSQGRREGPGETADIVGILKERKVDVVISYCPSAARSDPLVRRSRCSQAGCAS